MNKAIFLDRDGTLNVDKGYTCKIDDLEFYPDVFRALNILKNDFRFVIVTNQCGISNGFYSKEEFDKFNNKLVEELFLRGIVIDKTYCCPHLREDICDCAKPKIKFALEAKKEFIV